MNFKKSIISLICTASLVISSSISFAYNDIGGHWAEGYINDMKSKHILGQFEDSGIQPDKPINRAEAAELISDLAYVKYNYNPPYNSANKKFSDLTDGTRNTNKIRALSRLNFKSLYLTNPYDFLNVDSPSTFRIIDGYPDGSFQPYNNVTRAEFAKMLVTAIDCFGLLPPVVPWIPDNSDISNHWGKDYIMILFYYDIMDGYSHYSFIFRPDNTITRAEAIKMISQASQLPYDRHLNLSDGGTRPEYENSYYHIDKIDTSSSEKPYDPYEWEPGVKEKFEETVVRLGYAKPGDTFDYVKFGVYNSQGHYVVYKNGDYSHQFLGVNCKTGDFHG